MKIEDMPKVEYSNQRVLTTKQIAELYEVEPYRIKDNFRKARRYFTEGVHYFVVKGAALRDFKQGEGFPLRLSSNATRLYLWTVQGAARHCKMLNTSKAWEVFDKLERFYFECKGTPALADPNTELEILKEKVRRLTNQISTKKILELAVVYMLLMSDGSVKIGLTSNLTERIRQIRLETGLEVLDYRSTAFMSREDAESLERALRDKYADKNIGGEFFDIRFRDAILFLAA